MALRQKNNFKYEGSRSLKGDEDQAKFDFKQTKEHFLQRLQKVLKYEAPYPHFFGEDLLKSDLITRLNQLPFPAPSLDGVSGTREIHNKTRTYFDQVSQKTFPICQTISLLFQDEQIVQTIEKQFDANLSDTNLRIEYAQDTDGFWLEPHTDIGAKKFTMLLYLSDEEGHETLGTSIYDNEGHFLFNMPFKTNMALIFVPGENTWHGFEKRPIQGVRKTLIINYVTQDWRAKEQLSFPASVVKSSSSGIFETGE